MQSEKKKKDSLVSGMALWITCVVLAKLSSSLSMLEAAMLGRPEAICPSRRAEVLIVSLLRWVGTLRLPAIILIRSRLAVLVLGSVVTLRRRISTLLGRITLAVASWLGLLLLLLLISLVVALLAVLIVWA